MPRTRVRLGRLAALAATFIWIVAWAGHSSSQPGTVSASSHRYVVQSGDTLWGIARLQVGPIGDPRPLIEDIRQANQLRGPALTPGAQLILP
jgi:hypothetical protein